MGMMRTGTVLAAYLVRKQGWMDDKAVKEVMKLRPKSLFSNEAKKVIHSYAKSLRFGNEASWQLPVVPSMKTIFLFCLAILIFFSYTFDFFSFLNLE